MSIQVNNPLRILSLGWGQQSTTLAVMSALGDAPPLDFAVHADTSWEYQATYEYARQMSPWLEEHGVRVVTVKSPRTDVVQKWQGGTVSVFVPAYTLSSNGNHGQIRRQCTRKWKMAAIRRFITNELRQRGQQKRPGAVVQSMGISHDEWHRMRSSDVKYMVNEYPLVDMKMTRQDCVLYLQDHKRPVPPKSSCVFCPYHSKSAWKRLARQGGTDWERAVSVDAMVRDKRGGFPLFVHPSRRPLTEAVRDDGQLELWPERPCDGGYCGV